ncbi:Serine/threonine-protein kinase csk1 [Neolecta irregularis DAH-3]|uniref:Serine/threonine-protein kinase csk1 n=1 Tax=Neolecta irregularis (strain DAH-3) TaxID=1198029 RepID=A0A1U7LV66_NEOID|nr:Serine/threonine-protein kinase csk1 [Neolecta irregularis DAH-3]|eukprot:OLL26411.1 Serine/threonine-protein kinase csk1 [Neolecta irregularis DAH-3]
MEKYGTLEFKDEGRFSTIYKSESKQEPGKVVALKIVNNNCPPSDARREATILKALSHENIVSLIESFNSYKGYVLVLPFYLGTLYSFKTVLSISEIRRNIKSLTLAIAYLHERNIIHRDIKPSNCLLSSPDATLKLCDFGIAYDPSLSNTEKLGQLCHHVCSGPYRPPELIFGCNNYDVSLDLWSLGATIAEFYTVSRRFLFDDGASETGESSDLRLLSSMVNTLGTPKDADWPECNTFPHYGKLSLKEIPGKIWEEILPDADMQTIEVISGLLKYSSSQRMPANKLLCYDYFEGL